MSNGTLPTKVFPLFFGAGKGGSFYVPDRMTPEDFRLLRWQMEHALAVIERTSVAPEPPSAGSDAVPPAAPADAGEARPWRESCGGVEARDE